ncbi:MAG: hypothetical protein ACRCU5_01340 [Rhizobiaceae bacterium]
MKKSAFALTAATFIASIASVSSVYAETVRDHRTQCGVQTPNCRDHRDPVVVVPPRVQPEPPVVVIVDPTPVDNGHGSGMGEGLRISCKKGRQILRDEGFHRVRAFDCHGRTYGFFAIDGGHTVRVKMTNRGDIISVRDFGF